MKNPPTVAEYFRILKKLDDKGRLTPKAKEILRFHLGRPDMTCSTKDIVKRGLLRNWQGLHALYGGILGRAVNDYGYRPAEVRTCAIAYFVDFGAGSGNVIWKLRASFAKAVERLLKATRPRARRAKPNNTPSAHTSRRTSGYVDDARKRKQIENRAMMCAMTHYLERGLKVVDVSDRKWGYDLEAVAPSTRLNIEVKGTTGSTTKAFLTPNELKAVKNGSCHEICFVKHALSRHPVIETVKSAQFLKNFQVEPSQFTCLPKNPTR